MKTVTGIFNSFDQARRSAGDLKDKGVADDHINFLAPGGSSSNIEKIPAAAGEQPGMGKTVGSVVGAAIGTAAGAPLGTQTRVSTGLVNGNRPDVCVDTSGQIVAVWTNVDQIVPFQSNRKGVALRRLSAAGAPLGPEQVVVAPQATSVQPAVSCGLGSTFVVIWHTDLPPAADRTDILGQRYSRLGRKVGQPFRVNANITGYQRNPSIGHDTKGNFVVAWQADLGTREGIYGRRFNNAGTAIGSDFEVVVDNDNATEPAFPRVDHIGTAGNFVIVWQDGSRAILGRRYTP